jgi:hypothetical protein
VTGVAYLDMFKEFLMPLLKNRVVMKCCCSKTHCRKPLHFHIAVQVVLDRSFHENVLVEVVISLGHFVPPILHHLISSGVHEECFYASSLSTTSPGLADRIKGVVATVTPTILTNVWTELVYRCDMCQPAHSAHTEHL